MSKPALAVALALTYFGTSMPVLAQVACDPMPTQTIHSHDPWNATGYGGNGISASINLIFDLEVKCSAIELGDLGTILYDQGVGNPPVPDQRGNIGIVNIYTFPTTRTGNTGSMAGWTHVGRGEVAVTAFQNGYSPITNLVDPLTNGPVTQTSGSYGVAIELLPTNAIGTPPPTGTNGANAGSLHTLANSAKAANSWEDQYVKITNDGFMPGGWQVTGAGQGPFPLSPSPNVSPVFGSMNLVMDYDVTAAAGGSIAYGDGCYARHRTAYEDFAPSLTGPDLVDPTTPIGTGGGMTWTFLGSNYLVTPGAPAYVTPTSASITTGPYGTSTTTSWAGAISTAYSFPTTWSNGGFEHPAGVATQFGVSSRGFVYLGDVTVASALTCGPPNGFLTGATQYEPSIRPFHAYLDPTLGGGIHVDFDPATPPQWVRVSWDRLQEPGIPTSVSTFSLTMHDGGNVEIAYASLSNRTMASPYGDALVGYFEGNDAPIGPALDWSAGDQPAAADRQRRRAANPRPGRVPAARHHGPLRHRQHHARYPRRRLPRQPRCDRAGEPGGVRRRRLLRPHRPPERLRRLELHGIEREPGDQRATRDPEQPRVPVDQLPLPDPDAAAGHQRAGGTIDERALRQHRHLKVRCQDRKPPVGPRRRPWRWFLFLAPLARRTRDGRRSPGLTTGAIVPDPADRPSRR
ncbi:MAG: hypothetical protein KDC98_18100 [Planctomycetes bacterium]|nr:hypothetical protein [Planctomycetota bacterium]